jgi:hypothetical protein
MYKAVHSGKQNSAYSLIFISYKMPMISGSALRHKIGAMLDALPKSIFDKHSYP